MWQDVFKVFSILNMRCFQYSQFFLKVSFFSTFTHLKVFENTLCFLRSITYYWALCSGLKVPTSLLLVSLEVAQEVFD